MSNDGILFKADAETVAQTITALLTRPGYQVIRTFDLRSVLGAQPNNVCPCHGTVPCTCQFVVLRVYADTGGPVVVIAHGHDTGTRLRMIEDPLARPQPELALQVMTAMIEAALSQGVTTDGR
jgi:hypothetical protein